MENQTFGGYLLLAAAISACITTSPRNAAAAEGSDSPCDPIAKLYASCGRKFDYDGHAFYFKLKSGTRTALCDDGRKLGYYDRMDDMDIASIVSIPYETGRIHLPEIRPNRDPGRLRNEDLLKAVYGSSEAAVRVNLVNVTFLNQVVTFNSKLGAAQALFKQTKSFFAWRRRTRSRSDFLSRSSTALIN